jgi:hypothetical protein
VSTNRERARCDAHVSSAILSQSGEGKRSRHGGLSGVDEIVDVSNFPLCQKCKIGDLVPLSDFGSQGAAIHYKAWVCTNPDCGFNLKIRNGDLYVDEPISSGAVHTPRYR